MQAWSGLPEDLVHRVIHKLSQLVRPGAGSCSLFGPKQWQLEVLGRPEEVDPCLAMYIRNLKISSKRSTGIQISVLSVLEAHAQLTCQALQHSIRQAGVMRRVCKSWLAAFSSYPAQLISTKVKDLEKLVFVAPCMETLLIEDPTEADMNLIASCSHLRAFHAWSRSGIRTIDLSYLPKTIELIQLESVLYKLTTLHNLKCTKTTHAKLNCYSDSSDDIWRLTQHLPDLQVIARKMSMLILLIGATHLFCLAAAYDAVLIVSSCSCTSMCSDETYDSAQLYLRQCIRCLQSRASRVTRRKQPGQRQKEYLKGRCSGLHILQHQYSRPAQAFCKHCCTRSGALSDQSTPSPGGA